MNLQNIIGQTSLIPHLLNLVETGAIGHAYAFSGPSGMGKETIARAFATHLFCQTTPLEPCGSCKGCKMLAAGSHPDFHIVQPDTEKDTIVIDQIRHMQSQLQIKPLYGKKVILILEADKMNEAAQNCLLKTLEEPPAESLLMMTTIRFDKLLPTVQSRSIRLDLHRYHKMDMLQILKGQGMDGEKQPFCINYADGIPGRAVSLLSSATLSDTREKALATLPGSHHAALALDGLSVLLSNDRQRFSEAIDILMTIYRDMMILREGASDGLINDDKRDMISGAVLSSAAEWPMKRILLLDDWKRRLEENMNYQLCVDGLIAVLGN